MFNRFLLHLTEPVVRAISPFCLVLVAVYLSVAGQQAHQGFPYSLLSCTSSVAHLLDVSSHIKSWAFLPQSKIYPDLFVEYTHPWIRTHNRLAHPSPCQIVCYLIVPSFTVSRNQEQVHNPFLGQVVQCIVCVLTPLLCKAVRTALLQRPLA